MPALDEEFKQETTQATSGLAARFIYSLPGKIRPARNGLGLKERSRESRAAADRHDEQAGADAGAVRAALGLNGAEPGRVEGHVAGNVAFETLAAESAEEAAAISSALAEHGLEHYASVEDMLDADPDSDRMSGYGAEEIDAFDFERCGRAPSGLYEVYVPDRGAGEPFAPSERPYRAIVGGSRAGSLLEDPPGGAAMRAFLDEHGIDAVKARRSLNAACAQARGEVLWGEGLAPDARELGRLGLADGGMRRKFTLDVETVPWDAEAKIVTDNLAKLGVPFEVEVVEKAAGKSRGAAHVTVAELHAGYAQQVVDGLAESVRGFSRDRVRNYDALAATAASGAERQPGSADRAFKSAPLPQDQVHKVTCALQEMGIEHEVVELPDEGAFEVMVMESEVRDKGFRINGAAEALGRIRPPEVKAEAQRAYERSPQARQSRENTRNRVDDARERDKAARAQRQRNAKVSRDVKEATRSAEAQRRVAAEIQRRKTLGL